MINVGTLVFGREKAINFEGWNVDNKHKF